MILAAACLSVALATAPSETLHIRALSHAPSFSGHVDSLEWGSPSLMISKPSGLVRVWVLRWRHEVYIAALIEDATPYWGDDFVVSLDPSGDRSAAPDQDDHQWYFRRVLDSSVVFTGRGGRWRPPGDDPRWRLGRRRSGQGWAVRAWSGRARWSIVLKLDAPWFTRSGHLHPGIAFRTFDDSPVGWYTWPATPLGLDGRALERRPDLWAVVMRE